QRRVLPGVRAAPAGWRRLCDPPAAARATPCGRERHAPPQPRARGAGARVSRAVPVGLQPLQNSPRGTAPARVSRIVLALIWLVPERRRVTRVNLQKCFPSLSSAERERLARASFRAFCRGFVDRAVLWWAPPERIRRMVRIEGIEHLDAAGGRVVILAPHFA